MDGLNPLRARPDAARVIAALAVFAAVFIGLEVAAYRQKSATMDEPIHLAAGYVALADRDFRVDVTHPPFLRMWAALPMLAMSGGEHNIAAIDKYPILYWQSQAYTFARDLLYSRDADRILYSARFMIVVLGLALGVLLFAWAHEWLGFVPAIIVLAFYTIEPNLTVHASLVTTDFGATCFMFGAVYFLWRTCRRYQWPNVAGLVVCFCLAIVSKFSGVLLAPIVMLLLLIATRQRESDVTWQRACALMCLLAVASIATVWLVYGLRYAPSDSSAWVLRMQDMPLVRQRTPWLARLVGWVDAHRLLPNAFTQGFLICVATARALPAYLLGNYSSTGWWYYFPVAFIVKTPDAVLALTGIGLVVWAHGWTRGKRFDELFVLLPIAVFMLSAMTSGINIGVRHILPIYPFVLMIAGAAVAALIGMREPMARVALVGLGAFSVVTFYRAYPDLLVFFNQISGGPSSGIDYLADSNLDWGQDLKPLKAWMDDHAVQHFGLAYFGTADPAYYRISCTNTRGPTLERAVEPRLPAYVAISSTILSGVYLTPSQRQFYQAFRTQTPVAEIGHSIGVYWVERWPALPFDAADPAFPASCANLPLEP